MDAQLGNLRLIINQRIRRVNPPGDHERIAEQSIKALSQDKEFMELIPTQLSSDFQWDDLLSDDIKVQVNNKLQIAFIDEDQRLESEKSE